MTAQLCTLYLVRHGETDWNISKTIQGQLDIPLNQKGEVQAKELRESLKSVHFDAVFSSDLIRAKKTAEILTLERQLVIETTNALRERAFGIYQGKSMDEAHEKLYKLLEEYKDHPHIIESQVETNEHMVSRALTYIREISVGYQNKTVLLVSHGGLMRTLLIHLGYCTSKQFPPFGAIKNLAYIKLSSDGSEIKVEETSGITLVKED
jgi:broad specificity phosphatase PhoE